MGVIGCVLYGMCMYHLDTAHPAHPILVWQRVLLFSCLAQSFWYLYTHGNVYPLMVECHSRSVFSSLWFVAYADYCHNIFLHVHVYTCTYTYTSLSHWRSNVVVHYRQILRSPPPTHTLHSQVAQHICTVHRTSRSAST